MQASDPLFSRSIVLLLALALATPSVARAAEPSATELAVARELFAKGVALEEAHQWADALETFRKVAAVKMTAAVHFHLGLCLENTGKLVDALNEFNRADEATGADDPDAALIIEKSKKHVSTLEARVPRVVVSAPKDVDGVAVTLDDAPIAATLVGSAIPIDPGTHVVRATAPRRVAFERSFTASDSTSTKVDVVLPIDPNAPPDPVLTADAPSSTTSSDHVWPWIFGGFGVAALAGAGAMFALRANALSELESSCPSHSDCPPDKQSTYDRGRRDAILGDVLLGVGAAAVVTSIVLFSVGGRKEEAKTSFVVTPFGASVVGAF